jgi:ABC-type lipoprotein export system ATPase subunit
MTYKIRNGIKEKKERRILISTRNLTKTYGKGNLAVKAIDNINLEIKEGDFTAIIGPSGSGKTTLLNILGALDKPSSGEVIIDGIEISKIRESKLYKIRREKVGFIFQTYYLIPTLNILKNVLIPVLPLGRSGLGSSNQRKKINFTKKAKELLGKVGLQGKENRKPGQISGGEQQRVAIARALILDPILILADEPTGNLDTKTGMEIIELMKGLNQKEGRTFLIVTHDQRITKFCEKVIQLEDGMII